MKILFSKAPDTDTSHIFFTLLYLLYHAYDSHTSGSERYPVARLKCSSLYKSHLHEKSKLPTILSITDYLRWDSYHRFSLFQNSVANL